MSADYVLSIGRRARMIRRRRGLSLDVVAGLAGIGKLYLSMLERGQRGFNRRGSAAWAPAAPPPRLSSRPERP